MAEEEGLLGSSTDWTTALAHRQGSSDGVVQRGKPRGPRHLSIWETWAELNNIAWCIQRWDCGTSLNGIVRAGAGHRTSLNGSVRAEAGPQHPPARETPGSGVDSIRHLWAHLCGTIAPFNLHGELVVLMSLDRLDHRLI